MDETRIPPAVDEAGQLLERSDALDALAQAVEAVRARSAGRVVLVTGEAGIGKTTLLRALRARHGEAVRFLWGSCDPLFTPRPLGPLSDVAEQAGGELQAVVGEGVKPYDVADALLRELATRP